MPQTEIKQKKKNHKQIKQNNIAKNLIFEIKNKRTKDVQLRLRKEKKCEFQIEFHVKLGLNQRIQ